jgi:magnesium transporter
MPELHWQLGYRFAVGLMIAVGAGLHLVFKRVTWI